MKRQTIASFSIALLLSIFPLPLSAAGTAQAASAGSADSHNWSGYVAENGGFSAVSGDWTVPSVAASDTEEGDATWLGIGGMTSGDLIQVGTRALSSGTDTSYEAWYEVLPAAGVPIAMTVAAGDHMSASVLETSSGKWAIALDDLTTGARFSTTLSYDSSGSSAEWVEEAPQIAGAVVPLDGFSAVAFSDTEATTGTSETPAALSATRVSLVRESFSPLATPSALDASGAGFTISRD